MLIFPRVNFKNHILSGALTASIGNANPTHWPNEGLFLEYLKHFITCERPLSKGQLSLKNHESKLAIIVIDMQRKWHLLAYNASPHTSHKLQANCNTFGPYKTCYSACLNVWMLSNPGKPVITIDIAVGFIGKYFSKAFAKHNIEKGIHVTGIYSQNGNIFDIDELHHPMLLRELTVR